MSSKIQSITILERNAKSEVTKVEVTFEGAGAPTLIDDQELIKPLLILMVGSMAGVKNNKYEGLLTGKA